MGGFLNKKGQTKLLDMYKKQKLKHYRIYSDFYKSSKASKSPVESLLLSRLNKRQLVKYILENIKDVKNENFKKIVSSIIDSNYHGIDTTRCYTVYYPKGGENSSYYKKTFKSIYGNKKKSKMQLG